MVSDQWRRRRVLAAGGATLLTAASGCSALFDDPGQDPSEVGDVDVRSIEFGETVESDLEENEGTDPQYGDVAEPISFEGEKHDVVRLTMTSEYYDPHLVLEGPNGDVVGNDADAPSEPDSWIRRQLPQNGTYTAWAGSESGVAIGAYELTLELVEDDPGPPSYPTVDAGEVYQGTIRESDPVDPAFGDLASPVAFEGTTGTTVRVTMASDPLDPYLVLAGPTGEILGTNDDGASGTDARIEQTLDEDGQYVAWAGTASGEGTGPFSLTLLEVRAGP